eukprot:4123-Heterococcus_DN1.PRE.2
MITQQDQAVVVLIIATLYAQKKSHISARLVSSTAQQHGALYEGLWNSDAELLLLLLHGQAVTAVTILDRYLHTARWTVSGVGVVLAHSNKFAFSHERTHSCTDTSCAMTAAPTVVTAVYRQYYHLRLHMNGNARDVVQYTSKIHSIRMLDS